MLRLAALLLLPGCTTPLPPIDAPLDVAAHDAGPPDAGAALDVPASGDSDAPLGQLDDPCGTRGSAPCAEGLVCIFPVDAVCGAGGASGVCTAPDDTCPDTLAPVCGCDGRTYDNACLTVMAGVSIAENGACAPTCTGEVDCSEIAPRCVAGHVPSIVDGCWGPCVALDTCPCATDGDCPTGACDVAAGRCG